MGRHKYPWGYVETRREYWWHQLMVLRCRILPHRWEWKMHGRVCRYCRIYI